MSKKSLLIIGIRFNVRIVQAERFGYPACRKLGVLGVAYVKEPLHHLSWDKI